MATNSMLNQELEDAVLGEILSSPDRLPEAASMLHADDFADVRNRHAFEAMLALAERSEGVDILTVGEELARRGTFQVVGGRARLVELQSAVISGAHLLYHARGLARRGALRRLAAEAQAIASQASGVVPLDANNVEAFLQESGERILAATATPSIAGAELIAREVGRLRQMIEAGPVEGLDGLSTGFRDLDGILCGLHAGDLGVIAARTSVGKTALATCIADHVAETKDCRLVAFFSAEMKESAIVERLVSARSGVDHYFVRNRKLYGENREKVDAALREIEHLPLAIDDTRDQTIMSIRASARRLKRRHGLTLVVVDYLQLIGHRGAENRLQEVSHVSRQLKSLAGELDVPVIAAAQLNRQADTDDRPRLSHLRESGSIEQDADFVILLHPTGDVVNVNDPRTIEAIVAKNRNGPQGLVRLLFQPNLVRFVDIARDAPSAQEKPSASTTNTAQMPGFDQGGEYHA